MRKPIFLLALTLLAATAPAAQGGGQTCGTQMTYVYFGNGINTTRTQAIDAAVTLRATMRASSASGIQAGDKIQWGFAYNRTAADNIPGGAFIDVLQALPQWNNGLSVKLYRWISGIEAAPDWFRQAYLNHISTVDERSYVNDGDLRAHVTRYRELTEQGNRVIVVSHSQGNFYSNQAYRLVGSPGMAVLAVATPANVVEGGLVHVSLTGDAVVFVTPGALPPNVTNTDVAGWPNHSFIQRYIAGANSRLAIINRFRQAFTNTPFPNTQVGSGIITARLVWRSQPDLDLHVFEPNGAHVYYLALDGPSGYLDVDDVAAPGDEHYYVSCSTLETGTYLFGVNYFAGVGPETADLQITAGNVTRNFTRTLPGARGSVGNMSPVSLAQVNVTRNTNGTYDFDVSSGPPTLQGREDESPGTGPPMDRRAPPKASDPGSTAEVRRR